MNPNVDIFEPFKDVLAAYALAKQVQGMWSAARKFSQSDTVQNTLADVRLKARGHWYPVIIERLDEGTDPEHQHMQFDVAPAFSQERIEHALQYWPAQSFQNVFPIIGAHAISQASQDAELGEERSTTLRLDVFSGGMTIIYRLHGRVGGEWDGKVQDRQIHPRQLMKEIYARAKLKTQLDKEAKAQRKAERTLLKTKGK